MGERVDVWVLRFRSSPDEAAEGIVRELGVELPVAQEVVRSAPRVVKRNAEAEEAGRLREALERCGAEVQVRASRPPRPEPEAAVEPPGGQDARPSVAGRALSVAASGASVALNVTQAWMKGGGTILSGVALIGVGMVGGLSVFDGNGTIFDVFWDGFGIYLILAGGWRVLQALRGHEVAEKHPLRIVAFLACCTLAFVINAAGGVGGGDDDAAALASLDAPPSVAELIGDMPRVEARAWLEREITAAPSVPKQSVRALVDALYAAGAVRVEVVGPAPVMGREWADTLLVQLPGDTARSQAVQRAARMWERAPRWDQWATLAESRLVLAFDPGEAEGWED